MQTFPILYEDDQLLVIDKPNGIVVNRAQTVKDPTIQDWMESKLKVAKVPHVPKNPQTTLPNPLFVRGGEGELSTFSTNEDFVLRSGIVHRIDKETSGCLIIAKIPEAFFKLQAAFKERKVHKTYMALVHGKLVPETGTINAPVGRLPWNREHFGVVPGGKEAVTNYKVIRHYSSSGARSFYTESGESSHPAQLGSNNKELYTLVELFPQTGRTHQLRVHLKYLGFPIVGDYLYAGRKLQRDDRVWCPRVFLHAAKIEFPHPVTKQNILVTSPLPQELEQVLTKLQPL